MNCLKSGLLFVVALFVCCSNSVSPYAKSEISEGENIHHVTVLITDMDKNTKDGETYYSYRFESDKYNDGIVKVTKVDPDGSKESPFFDIYEYNGIFIEWYFESGLIEISDYSNALSDPIHWIKITLFQ